MGSVLITMHMGSNDQIFFFCIINLYQCTENWRRENQRDPEFDIDEFSIYFQLGRIEIEQKSPHTLK